MCRSFSKGEVDAGLGYWDWQDIKIRMKGIKTKVFVMSDDKVQIYGNVISGHRDWVAKNGDVIRRFLKASVKGWIDAYDDVKMTHKVMMTANPEDDPEFMRLALDVSMKLIGSPDAASKGWGWMDAKDWDGLQSALLAGKVIDKKVDPSTLFTNKYQPDNAKDWGKRM